MNLRPANYFQEIDLDPLTVGAYAVSMDLMNNANTKSARKNLFILSAMVCWPIAAYLLSLALGY